MLKRRWTKVKTDDGSETLRDLESGLSFRSTRGAYQESQQVFINNSRLSQRASPWRILEYGFGLGTNFRSLLAEAERQKISSLYYLGLEHSLLAPEQFPKHPKGFDQDATELAHTGQWHRKDESWQARLHQGDFFSYTQENSENFNTIFFDPFGPNDSPRAWTVEVFNHARFLATADCFLVTYASAGQIRRNLAAAGWYVATAPGPVGKREVTVASLEPQHLAPLKIRNRPQGTP